MTRLNQYLIKFVDARYFVESYSDDSSTDNTDTTNVQNSITPPEKSLFAINANSDNITSRWTWDDANKTGDYKRTLSVMTLAAQQVSRMDSAN